MVVTQSAERRADRCASRVARERSTPRRRRPSEEPQYDIRERVGANLLAFAGEKRPSPVRFHAEHVEKVRTDERDLQLLGSGWPPQLTGRGKVAAARPEK